MAAELCEGDPLVVWRAVLSGARRTRAAAAAALFRHEFEPYAPRCDPTRVVMRAVTQASSQLAASYQERPTVEVERVVSVVAAALAHAERCVREDHGPDAAAGVFRGTRDALDTFVD